MKHPRGVTLIEAIIYIALLGVLMSGVLGAVYQIVSSTSSTAAHDTTQEEGHFVLRKIEWALTGISGATVISSTELQSTKYDGTQVDIKLSGGAIVMQEGSGPFLSLTTPNVTVNSVQFSAIPPSGTGPAGISATLTLNNNPFVTTRYVRK